MKQKLINGDCIEELKKLPANSVDSIVTDPPYGLGFMNKEWDSPEKHRKLVEREKQRSVERKKKGTSPTAAPFTTSVQPGLAIKGAKEGKWFQDWCELWATECLRVLKPGGHILSFGGTRTYHRMAVAIEDAGFEIRDCIFWCYGSGFPKSYNIGKAIDKKEGVKGEVVGHTRGVKVEDHQGYGGISRGGVGIVQKGADIPIHAPVTEGAKKWEGWGTALKPAVEPVVLGRKPLSEKTIVENVLKHGTGGINIDDSRVTLGDNEKVVRNFNDFSNQYGAEHNNKEVVAGSSCGRFPANLILECICDEVIEGKEEVVSIHDAPTGTFAGGEQDRGSIKNYRERNVGKTIIHTNPDCPCFVLDKQSGDTGCSSNREKYKGKKYGKSVFLGEGPEFNSPTYTDKGGASRYFKEIEGDRIFYTAKASKSERNNGLEGFEEKDMAWSERIKSGDGKFMGTETFSKGDPKTKNNHPTVKPVKLMRYLIKLITPPNGTVLDPFMGSGTTGVAAKLEGFNFVGIEKEKEYIKIAEARIKNYKENPKKKTKSKKKVKKVKSKFWK